jgi:hypothetical protein
MGTVVVSSDAVMLKEAQITAQALKVTVKEDTFVYNSSAYRTPEGSVIEELVKRLPGAQVDESGKITINGKEVKDFLARQGVHDRRHQAGHEEHPHVYHRQGKGIRPEERPVARDRH